MTPFMRYLKRQRLSLFAVFYYYNAGAVKPVKEKTPGQQEKGEAKASFYGEITANPTINPLLLYSIKIITNLTNFETTSCIGL